jgi:hypothetical protein
MEHSFDMNKLTCLSSASQQRLSEDQSVLFTSLFQQCLDAASRLTPLQFRLLAQAMQVFPDVVSGASTLVDFFLEDMEQARADVAILHELGYLEVAKADPMHPWYRLTFFGMQVFGVAVFLTATRCAEVR